MLSTLLRATRSAAQAAGHVLGAEVLELLERFPLVRAARAAYPAIELGLLASGAHALREAAERLDYTHGRDGADGWKPLAPGALHRALRLGAEAAAEVLEAAHEEKRPKTELEKLDREFGGPGTPFPVGGGGIFGPPPGGFSETGRGGIF